MSGGEDDSGKFLNMVSCGWMVVVLAVHTVRCPIMEWWEVGVLLKTIGWVVAEDICSPQGCWQLSQ